MNFTGGFSFYYALIGFDLIANDSNVDIKMDLGFGIALASPTTLNFSVSTFSPLYFGVIKYISIFVQNQLFNGTITNGYFYLYSSPYTST